jgi:hypothetical protein
MQRRTDSSGVFWKAPEVVTVCNGSRAGDGLINEPRQDPFMRHEWGNRDESRWIYGPPLAALSRGRRLLPPPMVRRHSSWANQQKLTKRSPLEAKYGGIWREQSQISYAQNVTAPTLIMGDVGDPNVPLLNSYGW